MKTPLFSQSSSRGRGLDLRGGSKGVLARVDILAAAETFENLRAAVADAARLHVEQGTVVGLERVADVAECGAVRQDDLPVGADARQQLPVELRPLEGARDRGHDSTASPASSPRSSGSPSVGLQAEDTRQARIGSRFTIDEAAGPDHWDGLRAASP